MGAAVDAVEELGLERFKCHDSLIGIEVVPHLLRTKCFRRDAKNVDIYFYITVGAINQ